jgi:hypothetical protein
VCRWGYVNLSNLEEVVANYSRADIPLEGLWVDIEAMNNRFQVFTFDKGKLGWQCGHMLDGRLETGSSCAQALAYLPPHLSWDLQ